MKLAKVEAKEEAKRGRVLIWSCTAALAGVIAWASWAELDQVTRANGQVIASSRNQIIQVADGGVLSELRVHEGSVVKKGELLARFDRTRAETSYLESTAKAAGLKATVARLQAEVFGGTPTFPPELQAFPEFRANQMTLFTKRQGAVQAEVGALDSAMKLIKEELEMNLPLLETGDVSRAEVLKLRRQVVDIQAQITNRRNKYLQDSQTDLVKAQEDLAGVLQTVTQRKEQLGSTDIHVPTEDDLIIEAKVKPADIAFIKPGLPTAVKLDAYDYAIYGRLRGTVSYISADTLSEDNKGNEQPYYRVQIKTSGRNLTGKNGEPILIQPGMTATVEINTGRKTVLRYLTKPITKTFSESMGER